MAKTSAVRKRPRSPFQQLQELLANRRNDIRWSYEIGQLVAQLVPERNYGQGEISALVKKLGRPTHFENFLYARREFARLYRKTDVSELDGLSFAQVWPLLKIRDRDRRLRLQRQAIRHGWACREIRKRAQELTGKIPSAGRKPRPTNQAGPLTSLKETVRLSNLWLRSCEPALTSAATRLPRQLRGPKRDQLVAVANETLQALRQVEAVSRSASQRLRRSLRQR
jgi:hypothetical protein